MAELRRRTKAHSQSSDDQIRSDEEEDEVDERKPLISRPSSQVLTTESSSNFLSLLFGGTALQTFLQLFQRLFDYVFQTLGSRQSTPFVLTDSEQRALDEFRKRTSKSFDVNDEEHQKVLLRLWRMSFSNDHSSYAPVSDKWKSLGFQTSNPSTDFRGAGIFGLSNLIYFGERYPKRFGKAVEERLDKEFDLNQYPFAISGLNVTMLLFELLGWGFRAKLQKDSEPYPLYRRNFIKLLLSQPPKKMVTEDLIKFDEVEEDLFEVSTSAKKKLHKADLLFPDVSIFEEVYCAAFMILDEEWTKAKATYLEFPITLQATRKRMEELLPKIHSLDDLLQHNQRACDR